MKVFKNNFIKVLGFVAVFGLCIFMVSGVDAKAAEAVRLNLQTCYVSVDGTYWLRVYNLDGRSVTFSSSDTSIVTVSSSGKLKGRNCGDAVITVHVYENGSVVSTLQCDVHIGPAAVSLSFTTKRLVLKEGTAKRIYPLIIPKNTVEKPIYWTEDDRVATISYAGTIRALSVGSVDIHGMLDNGDSDVCHVIVLSDVDYEDFHYGRRSLEDILSDIENAEDGQETEAEVEEEMNEEPVQGESITPAPLPSTASSSAAAPVAPVAAK
ncbi:MAG: Ig-like domain-containing protein [Lachnospiraceae bacterium]|nr:Ig-like domain-containing protein [Lachnospiraceae bacterium]